MLGNVRQELSGVALTLAQAMQADDAAAVGKRASSDIAGNFGQTGFLIRNLSEAIAADSLAVTQLYQLDANAPAAANAPAEFACALTGSASEVDFGIDGLPPGLYGFAIVEADGPRPWTISMLLKQEGGEWKLAGLYPHARTAAGHDGLWWWTDARAKAKAGQAWNAWLEYGLADELLRPANFATSTHLDKLRTERNGSAPAELRDGLSENTPLALKGAAAGETVAITALNAQPSEDGKRVNLVLHYKANGAADRAQSVAAAKALVSAHAELGKGFDGLIVVPETGGQAGAPLALGFNELH
jgi:hypothetical protein